MAKENMISLRVNDKMVDWLDSQGDALGMTRSEVVRFWLNNSMLTYERSSTIVSESLSKQLEVIAEK